MDERRKILVGIVGAAQGVKGEVRVKSYTGDPKAIGTYGPLDMEGGRSALVVMSLRPLKDDMLVVRFEGIADRDAASALTNTKLYVDRGRLPPPDDEEFYQTDLIGLAAETSEGGELGRVVAVQNFGAGDILEIVPPLGASLLVPFTKAFVPVLDFERGRLVVAPGAFGDPDEDEPAHNDGPAS